MDPQLDEIIRQIASLNSAITGISSNITKLAMTAKGSAGGRTTAPSAVAGGGGDLKGALAGVFGMMTAKLAIVLGPLTAFASILGSANSGFSIFLKTVNVLAASLAPILLPGFALLGAAVLTVSDYIWSQLQPRLKEWMLLVMNTAIPAIEELAAAIKDTIGWFRKLTTDDVTTDDVADWAGRAANFITGGVTDHFGLTTPPAAGGFAKGAMGALRSGGGGDGLAGIMGGAGAVGAKENGGGFMGKFLGNLKMFAQEMKIQNGPTPQFMGLAQASRSAQQAALGQSPLEAKQQMMIQQATDALIGAINGIGVRVAAVNLGAGQ